MPHHKETRRVSYTQGEMFALVAGVEHYPEFLPWCLKAVVCTQNKETLVADLTVGTKLFRETFTSKVTLKAPEHIKVAYGGGALKHLTNSWHFKKAPKGGCDLTFEVAFALKSSLLNALLEVFFEKAFHRITKAFEERARELYGERDGR